MRKFSLIFCILLFACSKEKAQQTTKEKSQVKNIEIVDQKKDKKDKKFKTLEKEKKNTVIHSSKEDNEIHSNEIHSIEEELKNKKDEKKIKESQILEFESSSNTSQGKGHEKETLNIVEPPLDIAPQNKTMIVEDSDVKKTLEEKNIDIKDAKVKVSEKNIEHAVISYYNHIKRLEFRELEIYLAGEEKSEFQVELEKLEQFIKNNNPNEKSYNTIKSLYKYFFSTTKIEIKNIELKDNNSTVEISIEKPVAESLQNKINNEREKISKQAFQKFLLIENLKKKSEDEQNNIFVDLLSREIKENIDLKNIVHDEVKEKILLVKKNDTWIIKNFLKE